MLLDDVPFKVIISPEGVSITQKRKRKAPAVPWETIMRLSEVSRVDEPAIPSPSETELPNSMAAEIATEIAGARAALVRAGEKLGAANDLPPELKRQMTPDPTCGSAEERPDWFIEPLLTVAELASVLRVSTAAVARLPIRWISIAGERRYRQSEVRHYLEREEREGAYSRW